MLWPLPAPPHLLLCLALLAAPGCAGAAKRPFPSYAHAVRCSGLTGAWMREVSALSDEGIRRFDAALYWGLATMDVARRAKMTAAEAEAAGEAAVAQARTELAGGGSAAESARRELAACVAEVPPTDGKRR